MAETKSFKMVGGDEVVATVLDTVYYALPIESPLEKVVKYYVVRRPHILQFQPMGSGQVGLAFVPWTLSNPSVERLEIPGSAVLMTFDPDQRVETQYLEQTSGISLAKPAGSRISS